MTATLAERVDNLEKELAGIKTEISGQDHSKDWRAWLGASKDDPGFDDMIRLGRENREAQKPADDAGS